MRGTRSNDLIEIYMLLPFEIYIEKASMLRLQALSGIPHVRIFRLFENLSKFSKYLTIFRKVVQSFRKLFKLSKKLSEQPENLWDSCFVHLNKNHK